MINENASYNLKIAKINEEKEKIKRKKEIHAYILYFNKFIKFYFIEKNPFYEWRL